jgi:hypothetical protein
LVVKDVIVGKIMDRLTPGARRRAAAALGLAVAAALMRVGDFAEAEVWTWVGVPDTAQIRGRKVDAEVGRGIRIDAVEALAKMIGPGRWDGVTLVLKGRLDEVELNVEIDVYAGGRVPVEAGIINEEVDVIAEPRGRCLWRNTET